MRNFLLVFLLIISQLSIAQNVGIGTNTPHESAALEVAGTDKGIIIPRMTMEQRMGITNPTKGLTVYQTNSTEGYWYYDGAAWGQLMRMPTGGIQGQVITLCDGELKWTNNGVCPVIGITDHSCGATNVHNSTVAYGTMYDQEGNRYRTIQIGTQTWMAENLRTTKYRNSISITNITDNTQWVNNTTGAYCSYNNNTTNDCPYGKLYNWYAVVNSNGICPIGWHVPTDAEFTTLGLYASSMKSTGTTYWISNTGATNSSGLSGLPGGFRSELGDFLFMRGYSYWYTSTEYDPDRALILRLEYNSPLATRFSIIKKNGVSVRCLKD